MRRLLALAAVCSLALAAPATAAPDTVKCTRQMAETIVLYDGSLESYPAFLVAVATAYADCVA